MTVNKEEKCNKGNEMLKLVSSSLLAQDKIMGILRSKNNFIN